MKSVQSSILDRGRPGVMRPALGIKQVLGTTLLFFVWLVLPVFHDLLHNQVH